MMYLGFLIGALIVIIPSIIAVVWFKKTRSALINTYYNLPIKLTTGKDFCVKISEVFDKHRGWVVEIVIPPFDEEDGRFIFDRPDINTMSVAEYIYESNNIKSFVKYTGFLLNSSTPDYIVENVRFNLSAKSTKLRYSISIGRKEYDDFWKSRFTYYEFQEFIDRRLIEQGIISKSVPTSF